MRIREWFRRWGLSGSQLRGNGSGMESVRLLAVKNRPNPFQLVVEGFQAIIPANYGTRE